MTIITLTRQDTPSRPVTLNTDFIAAVNPLRKVMLDANSQVAMTKTVYAGTEVVLSNGTKYNVMEAYPDVVSRLNAASEVAYSTEAMPDPEPARQQFPATPVPPRGTVLAASGVAQLANTVTDQPGDDEPKVWSPPAAVSVIDQPSDNEKFADDEDSAATFNPEPKPESSGSLIGDDVITKYGDERSAPETQPEPVKSEEPEAKEPTMAEKLAARPKPAKKAAAKGVKPVGSTAAGAVRVDPSPTEHAADE